MKSTLTECCIGGSRCLYKRLSGRPYVAVDSCLRCSRLPRLNPKSILHAKHTVKWLVYENISATRCFVHKTLLIEQLFFPGRYGRIRVYNEHELSSTYVEV